MHPVFRRALALALVVSLFPATVLAGVSGFMQIQAGAGTYEMGDVNNLITATNPTIEPLTLQSINGGLQGGFELGFQDEEGPLGVSIGYTYLSAASSASGEGATVDFNFPSHQLTTRFYLTWFPQQRFRISGGLGLGVLFSAGDVSAVGGGGRTSIALDATDNSFEGILSVGMNFTRTVGLNVMGGYRWGALNGVTSAGQDIDNDEGKPFTVDYNGPFFMAGIRIEFGREI